jgi:hypothetical protein
MFFSVIVLYWLKTVLTFSQEGTIQLAFICLLSMTGEAYRTIDIYGVRPHVLLLVGEVIMVYSGISMIFGYF